MRVNSINDENNTNDKNEVISDEDEEIPESPTFHTDVADMLQVGKITLIKAHLSTLMASLCAIWFYCLSHSFTLGSSFLMVLQIFSGFSFKLTLFLENKQGNTIFCQTKYHRMFFYIQEKK